MSNQHISTGQEVAEEVWDQLSRKLDNPDERLTDDEFGRRWLWVQRRNAYLSILDGKVAYQKALDMVAALQQTDSKDKEKMAALAQNVTAYAQQLTDAEFRLKAVLKVIEANEAAKIITEHYGDIKPDAYL